MIKCDECKSYLANDNHCIIWLGEACGWQWVFHREENYKECHINHFPPTAQQPQGATDQTAPHAADVVENLLTKDKI